MDPPYAYRVFGVGWTRTEVKRFPPFAIRHVLLEAEFDQSRMIGGSNALRPAEPSLGLVDQSPAHQASAPASRCSLPLDDTKCRNHRAIRSEAHSNAMLVEHATWLPDKSGAVQQG